MIPFRRKQRMIDNFQRYFLVFSIFIFSYLLLINWNPPAQEESISENTLNDSEYLPTNPTPEPDSFVDESSSFAESSNITSLICGAEETVEVSNENQKLEISLSSGQIIKSELLNYPLEINGQANTLLFNKCGKENYFLDGGFVVSGMSNAPEGNYFSVLSKSEDSVEIIRRLPNGSTHSKKISLGENFRINFDEEFFNGEVVEVSVAPYAKINRSSEKTISGSGGIFTQPSSWAYLGPAFSYDGENYDKRSFSEIEEVEFRTSTSGGWISMIQHYFLTSLLPNQSSNSLLQGKKNKNDGSFSVGFVEETKKVAPGASIKNEYAVYSGPKIKGNLDLMHPKLGLAIDYGFLYWIGQPIFWVMNLINQAISSWGWSIVLVTVLIKIFLWPLSYVAYKNMGKMRQLQPKLKELQERYGDDRQAMSREMMALYSKEKVNPALGCLPMLLQMPFFLAFYWVLIETVELRHAPFMFWIVDLSVRDPLFILPLLNMGAMYLMQLLQPQPAGVDPMQARIFKFMPIIFGVLFAFFPAGLVLYWLVNSLVSALQMLMHGPKKAA